MKEWGNMCSYKTDFKEVVETDRLIDQLRNKVGEMREKEREREIKRGREREREGENEAETDRQRQIDRDR